MGRMRASEREHVVLVLLERAVCLGARKVVRRDPSSLVARGDAPREILNDDHREPAIPGSRNIVIYVDESGMHKAPYYGFGLLWLPWERRGDLSATFERLRRRYSYTDEVKWTSAKRRPEFYAELVDEFFKKPWMMFHCLLVRREDVRRSAHGGRDEAMQKHLTMLLRKKIEHFAKWRSGATYRVRADKLPMAYPKADEVIEKILASQLRKTFGEAKINDVRQCESRTTVGVQLVDLLLGAVTSAWQGDAVSPEKLAVRQRVAAHIGWTDLRHDTVASEVKFNVWHFHDPQSGVQRIARTKPVILRHPMPLPAPAAR